MTSDGRIRSTGSLSNALAKDKQLSKELEDEAKILKQDDDEIEGSSEQKATKPTSGKLIMSEEVSGGHVGWKSCRFSSLSRRTLLYQGVNSDASISKHAGTREFAFILGPLPWVCYSQPSAEHIPNLGSCFMDPTI